MRRFFFILIARTLGVFLGAAFDSTFAKNNDIAKRYEQGVAKARQEPLIFYVAKGAPNACGPGCSEWIAVEGFFDADAPRRFNSFLLPTLYGRDLPVFFNSRGGSIGGATAIGRLLRKYRLRAGVGQTLPDECGGSKTRMDCRRRIELKDNLKGRLVMTRARCTSACVYALIGGVSRQVGPGVLLGIHNAILPPSVNGAPKPAESLDETNNRLKRYAVEMGIDSGLVEAASQVSPFKMHYLDRDEIRKFGIDPRQSFETGWLAYRGLPDRLLLIKSVTYPARNKPDTFRTSMVRLGCVPFESRLRLSYTRELTEGEDPTALKVQVGVDNELSELHMNDFSKSLVEKFIDPNDEGVQVVLRAGHLNVVETPEKASIVDARAMNISTAGLAAAVDELRAHCAARNPRKSS
ncbi:MAG: hypothetical protein ACXWJ6_04955 [Xanthobacteraceae bacterium]